MSFNKINSRNPSTLSELEIIDKDGVSNAHLVKRVASNRRYLQTWFGRIYCYQWRQHRVLLRSVLIAGSALKVNSLGLELRLKF